MVCSKSSSSHDFSWTRKAKEPSFQIMKFEISKTTKTTMKVFPSTAYRMLKNDDTDKAISNFL